MLSGLRVLDLANATGSFCGYLLARLGADVVKVEEPGGDAARKFGPFFKDSPDPEKSLYWFAYNVGKKGITLKIDPPEGRRIFERLVKNTDIVIETYPVGYMDSIGLGYQALSAINPGIILTSITPFGQTGPYKHYKSSDLVAMATGGMMALCGDPGKPPLRLNPDHAYYQAGTNAALGTLIANYNREMISGKGQHVDVSMHDSIVRENNMWAYRWEFLHTVPNRAGNMQVREDLRTRLIYPCRDGFVVFYVDTGRVGRRDLKALAQWIHDEGIEGVLDRLNLDTFHAPAASDEVLKGITNQILSLTGRYTKKELEEKAAKRGVMLRAVKDIQDVLNYEPLAFRNFFVDVEHPELSTSIKFPGHLFKSSEVQDDIPKRRAPRIGEHNKEVYCGELGLAEQELARYQCSGII
ncbi:MAG: CoA transferase [Chloroflexi bacterium]|nr:CoA transferase [Chloroflexota bacterium]